MWNSKIISKAKNRSWEQLMLVSREIALELKLLINILLTLAIWLKMGTKAVDS